MADDDTTSFWPAETVRFLLVWAVLLGLLALTVAISLVDVGAWNIVANIAIAALKAGLVMWIFMHLNALRGVVRLVALGALLWVAILFALTLADYLTRPY